MWEDHINKDPTVLRTFENKLSLEWATHKPTSRFYFKRNWLVYSKRKPASKLQGTHCGWSANRVPRATERADLTKSVGNTLILLGFTLQVVNLLSLWDESVSQMETCPSFKVWVRSLQSARIPLFSLPEHFQPLVSPCMTFLHAYTHECRISWKNLRHHFSPTACYLSLAPRAKQDLWEHHCYFATTAVGWVGSMMRLRWTIRRVVIARRSAGNAKWSQLSFRWTPPFHLSPPLQW